MLAFLAMLLVSADASFPSEHAPIPLFFDAISADRAESREALERIGTTWKDGYAALLVELAYFFPPQGEADSSGRAEYSVSPVRRRLVRFLEKQTGKKFGDDLDRWRHWIWSRPYDPHPDYALFKGQLYEKIDARMQRFFPPGANYRVRLDQIVWGGVSVNGIPPLIQPKRIGAAEADYLKDRHVVFGIAINGESRAYPKRILAWHEMAQDRIGGVDLTIVYCTLCGSVIPYASQAGGTRYIFGTSGLLYRSNKLMFDEQTQSLWSSTYGMPVGGPLVDKGIRLESYPVVTTTWGEWKATHPDTTVLSLDTGFRRDYGEGVAYADYFSTDRLMFQVPETDGRLKNKAEILVFPFTVHAADAGNGKPLAIAADFLRKNTLYQVERAGKRVLIATSPRGANRAYEIGTEDYVRWLDERRIEDDTGRIWRMTEDALVPQGHDSSPRPRLAAHRAFWFGWYAQHNDAELIRMRGSTRVENLTWRFV